MRCTGKTIFSGQTLNLLYFNTYIDNSVCVTFHTLVPNHEGDLVYKPFLTPSVPAFELMNIGKIPDGLIIIRDYDKYEDAVVALQDEGAIEPGSIRQVAKNIVSARLKEEVYNNFVRNSHMTHTAGFEF